MCPGKKCFSNESDGFIEEELGSELANELMVAKYNDG